MRIMVAWSLMAVALAGCSGGGGAEGGDVSGDDATEGADSARGEMVTLRTELAAPIHRTVWGNGSFAFYETCNTGGCITQDGPAFHRTELELPRDVPTRLAVDLTYSSGPQNEIFGGMDTWIEVDATFYRYVTERNPGHTRLDITLLPTSSAQIVVAAYNPTDDVPEMAYELRITLDAESEIVTPGVPVGVEVGPGDEILVRAPTEVTTTFLLYAPDDSLLGRFETNHTIPADAAEGEYVVLIPPGAPAGNVSTDSGATSMKTLGLSFVNGDVGVLPPNGPYEVEMEVAGYPLAVGWLARSTPGSNGIGVMASMSFSITMTGPNGIELAEDQLCGLCLAGDWGFGMTTESGDPRVEAGMYLLQAETEATREVEVTPYAIFIQRFE